MPKTEKFACPYCETKVYKMHVIEDVDPNDPDQTPVYFEGCRNCFPQRTLEIAQKFPNALAKCNVCSSHVPYNHLRLINNVVRCTTCTNTNN
jgi:hypothetical protein